MRDARVPNEANVKEEEEEEKEEEEEEEEEGWATSWREMQQHKICDRVNIRTSTLITALGKE